MIIHDSRKEYRAMAEPPETRGWETGERAAFPGSAHVKSLLPCADCGYVLRGLPKDGRCPECGRPVESTRRGYRITQADWTWIDGLAQGSASIRGSHTQLFWIVAVHFVMWTISSWGTGGVGNAARLGTPGSIFSLILALAAFFSCVEHAYGALLMTRRPKDGPVPLQIDRPRRAARASAVILPVLVLCVLLAIPSPPLLAATLALAAVGWVIRCTLHLRFVDAVCLAYGRYAASDSCSRARQSAVFVFVILLLAATFGCLSVPGSVLFGNLTLTADAFVHDALWIEMFAVLASVRTIRCAHRAVMELRGAWESADRTYVDGPGDLVGD